jgi:tape measure domain-containing protein
VVKNDAGSQGMTDLAELGIVIKSDADKAAVDLDKMTKSAVQADKAADNLNKTSSGLNSTFSSLQQATQRVMGGFNNRTLTDFSAQMDKAGSAAQQAAARFNTANDAFTRFGQGIGASSASVRAATDAYLQASSKLNNLAKDTATVSQAQGVLKEAYKSGQINAAQYTASLAQLENTHQVNARTAKVFGGSLDGVKKSMADVGQGAAALTSIMGGLGLVFGAKHILEQADEYTQLQAKIKIITATTGDYLAVSKGLFDASVKTGTVLEGNIRLFQQLSLVTHSLGVNNAQLVTFIGSFDKLAAINKLDAGHLNSTILELSHALEQGTVRAQQFNRLLLDFPAIGKVISDGLGKPLVEIRELIKKGQFSSQDLFNAITKGLKDVDAQFASLPPSLARSLTSFNTEMSKAFAQITTATGTINGLSAALGWLGKNADIVAAAMTGLGIILAGSVLAGIAALLGPATLLVAALAALAAAAVYYTSQTSELQKIQEAHIGVVARAVDIEKQLKEGRENGTAALRNEQFEQIKSTQLLIKDTEERLKNLKVLYQQQNALQQQELKNRPTPKLRAGEIDLTNDVAKQNGFFDAGGYGDKIADADAKLKEFKGTEADLFSIMKTGLTVQQNLDVATATHTTHVQEATKSEMNRAATLQKNIDAINADYTNTQKLLEAKKQGVEVYNNMINQINAETKAVSLGLVPGTDRYNKTVQTIIATAELNDKLKGTEDAEKSGMKTQAQYSDLLSQMGLLGKDGAGQLAAARIEQFKMTDAYKQASPAFQDYIDKLETGIQDYKDTEVTSVKATKALAEFDAQYKKLIEAKAKPFIQASEDIQRGLADSIEQGIKDGFGKGKDPIKAFVDTIKETLIKTLSNALAAQITSQFIAPLMQSAANMMQGQEVGNQVGSSLGVQQNSGAANIFGLLGQAKTAYGMYNSFSGGGGTSMLSSLFGSSTASASGTASGLGGLFGSGAASTGATSFGAGIEGFGSLGSVGSFGGAGASGISGVGSGLTGEFAAAGGQSFGAGAGALGSSAASGASSFAGSALPIAGAALAAYSIISDSMSGHKDGPLMGGAKGAMAGAAIAGPWGAVVGGVIGAIAGSLGPSHPQTHASAFQGNVGGDGTLTDLTYGQDRGSIDTAKSLATGLSTMLKSFTDMGINLSQKAVYGDVNSVRGNKYQVLGPSGLQTDVAKSFSFDPSNTDSVSLAIAQVGIELAKGANIANKSLTTALDNIKTDGRKAEDVLADLNFAVNFDSMEKAPKVVGQFETAAKSLMATFADGEEKTNRLGLSIDKYKTYETNATKAFFDAVLSPAAALSPLQQQLKDLHTTFDDLREAAKVLGYSLDTVNQAEKVATAQVGVNFNQSIKSQIQQITDPTAYAIAQLDAQFATIRSDAIASGGDLALVAQLYNLDLAKILKDAANQQATIIANDNTIVRSAGQIIADQVKLFDLQTQNLNDQISAQTDLAKAAQQTRDSFRQLATTLGAAKDSLLTDSSLSPYSPEDRYGIAKDQFNTVSQAALLGDQDALAKLPDVSKQLLSASKDYNGMFAGYVADFDRVQDVLGRTRDLANRQADIADQQLTAANQQITLLQQQVDLLSQVKEAVQNSTSAQPATSAGGGVGVSAASLTDTALASRNAGAAVDLNAMTGAGVSYRQHWTFATLAGYTGTFGSGGWNAYAKANPTAAAEFNQLVQAAGGTPVKFAVGGHSPSLAPYIAGENGPEMIWDKKPRYVSNAHETRRMLTGNNGGQDDLTIAVRELIGEIRKGNNISVSGTQILHDVLTEIKDGTHESADNIRKMAYKKNGTA